MSLACYLLLSDRATAFYEIHQNCAESFLWESSKLCDVPLRRGLVTVARGLLSNIPGIVQRWPLTLPPSTTIITFQSSHQQCCSKISGRAGWTLGNPMPSSPCISSSIIITNIPSPNWTMACIPDIVEHKASVTFRRPRSVRSLVLTQLHKSGPLVRSSYCGS